MSLMPITALIAELAPRLGRGAVLEAVEALRRRSLLERTEVGAAAALSLQSVVLEYVTNRQVQVMVEAIDRRQPALLVDQPVIKAQGKDYVRQTQERLIGEPVLRQLEATLGRRGVEQHLVSLLDTWRAQPRSEHRFGPGNVVDLLRLQRRELRGVNLAGLAIRQAYFDGVERRTRHLLAATLPRRSR